MADIEYENILGHVPRRLQAMVFYYQAIFGAHEMTFYAHSDAKALRIIERWERLFWRRYQQHIHERHPGSMADAEANGWYGAPKLSVYRSSVDSAGIIKLDAEQIHTRVLSLPKP